MNIIDRYIGKTFIHMFGLCLGALSSVYLIIDFFEKMSRFARNAPAARDVALFFIYKLPEIISQVTPLAILLATLLTLGGLTRTNELTALRSCGIGIARISYPIILIALTVTLLHFFTNEFILPVTYQKTNFIEAVRIKKKSAATFFRQNNIWFRDKEEILQARLFDPSSQTLRGVTLWAVDEQIRPVRRLDAETGVLTATGWVFHNASERLFTNGIPSATHLETSLPVKLNLKPDDLRSLSKYADDTSFRNLLRYIRKLEESGYDTTRYAALLQAKIASPFTCLVMAFLGIPFATRGGRGGGITMGIGASMGIGFSFYVLNAILLPFGQTGVLPPFVSAWAAPIIFLLIACWLALTVNR